MDIYLDELLTLPRFIKIVKLLPNSNIIKVSLNGELYDISGVIDNKDVTVFEIDD